MNSPPPTRGDSISSKQRRRFHRLITNKRGKRAKQEQATYDARTSSLLSTHQFGDNCYDGARGNNNGKRLNFYPIKTVHYYVEVHARQIISNFWHANNEKIKINTDTDTKTLERYNTMAMVERLVIICT